MVLRLDFAPHQAKEKFEGLPTFLPFKDARSSTDTYKCTMLHCISAIKIAKDLKLFDLETFDLNNYEYYDKIENGGFNWILPKKILAFRSPLPEGHS